MRGIIFIFAEILMLVVMTYLFYFDPTVEKLLKEYYRLDTIVSFLFFLVIVDFSVRLIKYFYNRRHKNRPGRKDNFHYGVNNIAKLMVGVGLIVTLFGVFGIDFKSLLTSLSIVAAAIAIISKEFIYDFLVGIYFSFSRNFEINDYVKIGEQKGKIQEIDMLKIKLLNDDDDLLIIPNAKVYLSEIINYTKRDIRLMSIDFQLDLLRLESIEVLESELISSLEEFSSYIEADSYTLKIVNMKKDYIDLKFQYTLKQIDRDIQKSIRKSTVRQVFNHISSKGIN